MSERENMQNENFTKNIFYYKECIKYKKHFLQDIFYGITVAFETNKNSLMKKPPTMMVLLLLFRLKVNL